MRYRHISRDLAKCQFVGLGIHRLGVLALDRQGDLRPERVAGDDRHSLFKRAGVSFGEPLDRHLGRLARGQLAIFEFGYGASTGGGSEVEHEGLIPSIGEDEVVFALLAGVHFAEVELILVHGCLTAAGGRRGPDSSLPGVLTELEHGGSGADTCTTRHRYQDCDEDSHICSVAKLGGGMLIRRKVNCS